MKHWRELGNEGIDIQNSSQYSSSGRILTVWFEKDDKFTLVEGCDSYFQIELSKAEMLELIHELKQWVLAIKPESNLIGSEVKLFSHDGFRRNLTIIAVEQGEFVTTEKLRFYLKPELGTGKHYSVGNKAFWVIK